MKMRTQTVGVLAVLAIMTLNLQFSSALAQNSVLTYQGRVTDGGTNFTGVGQFKFALVTSSNASQTAVAIANTPSGGYITGYTMIAAGNGYVSAPAVTVSGGGGAGAGGVANLSGGMVTEVAVTNPGNGHYTSAPVVTIAPPPVDIVYTTYWSNDGTSANGSEPGNPVTVTVNDGLFTVALGDTNLANMGAIDAFLFTQSGLQLRIWFSDGVNGFVALDPAQNLTSAPYSASAVSAATATTALTANTALIANTALSANSLPALSVQQNSDGAPDVIGGASINAVLSGVEGATIGGGGSVDYQGYGNFTNSVTADFGTVSGGAENTAGGYGATVSGGTENTATADGATASGGVGNTASGVDATVAGGFENTASGVSAFVGGGGENQIKGNTITNVASGDYSMIGGGAGNSAAAQYSTVGGGDENTAGARTTTVSGGLKNMANAISATVSGGSENTASGVCATVPGGINNLASGVSSLAAGNAAQATNSDSFVWSDGSATTSSTTNDQFMVRASGGVVIYTSSGLTAGVSLPTGGGCWASLSDRNAKTHFSPVAAQAVLAKVAALPIEKWSYKTEQGVQHIGPMAQDFYAAFGVGEDGQHITEVDESGVALAAIQGLNKKLEEKDAKINELERRLNELENLAHREGK